ncbi:MAG: DUF434 domain-containing protein [Deltaproteobacteria bacterium]|nr:DUF434 domain-containing protein [Deltaproteobacteria bacterium]
MTPGTPDRGAHPGDAELLGPAALPRLREASADLAWLLGRGYAETAALALVGDRFQLPARARTAVLRGTCTAEHARSRRERRVSIPRRQVVVDGFNVLVTVESALAGAPLVRGTDGLLRDLAGVHGAWRSMAWTERALDRLAEVLAPAAAVRWLLDRPVAHSGRLASRLRDRGFDAETVWDVDATLAATCAEGTWVGATADGPLLGRLPAAVDLVGPVVVRIPDAWIVDLG